MKSKKKKPQRTYILSVEELMINTLQFELFPLPNAEAKSKACFQKLTGRKEINWQPVIFSLSS